MHTTPPPLQTYSESHLIVGEGEGGRIISRGLLFRACAKSHAHSEINLTSTVTPPNSVPHPLSLHPLYTQPRTVPHPLHPTQHCAPPTEHPTQHCAPPTAPNPALCPTHCTPNPALCPIHCTHNPVLCPTHCTHSPALCPTPINTEINAITRNSHQDFQCSLDFQSVELK